MAQTIYRLPLAATTTAELRLNTAHVTAEHLRLLSAYLCLHEAALDDCAEPLRPPPLPATTEDPIHA